MFTNPIEFLHNFCVYAYAIGVYMAQPKVDRDNVRSGSVGTKKRTNSPTSLPKTSVNGTNIHAEPQNIGATTKSEVSFVEQASEAFSEMKETLPKLNEAIKKLRQRREKNSVHNTNEK
jgi:hypothetical protein